MVFSSPFTKWRIPLVIIGIGLLLTLASGQIFLKALTNYSGFNESYVYGYPLGWLIVEKIFAPSGYVRELTHIAAVPFAADTMIRLIVSSLVFVATRMLATRTRQENSSNANNL